jgi:chitin synthase
MNLQQQKYLILLLIFSLNFVLIVTFIIYNKKWYAYLAFLILSSILNASASILNITFRMCRPSLETYRIKPKNYMYVVPCYNESEAELTASLHSLIEQRVVKNDKRFIVIICDGKVKGAGNSLSTDLILKKILNIQTVGFKSEYMTWNGTKNGIYEYTCDYIYHDEKVPVLLLIKENNYGKRDSLVLIRHICYLYNRQFEVTNIASGTDVAQLTDVGTLTDVAMLTDVAALTPDDFIEHMMHRLGTIYPDPIDYLIGIDADTIFDYNCTYELIQGIERDDAIHGCVGYVDISPQMNFKSLFVLYQYAEYMFAQCLRRQAQSNITQKVSCLSGCNQILRISKETCGEKILKLFNYCPKETDNIFTHIRSYASEDRNHVCTMLSLYPYVKTTQTLKAISYTTVPTSVSVFLSQRRRWNLGANTNDMLLIYLPGINIFERILAGVNVFTFTMTPFVGLATIYFLRSIITNPTLLMLYLSTIMLVPIFHSFLTPLFIKPLGFKDTLYYYLSYLFFLICSGLVSITCFTYAVLKMDIIKWGKTRMIDTQMNEQAPNQIVEDTYKMVKLEQEFTFDIIV